MQSGIEVEVDKESRSVEVEVGAILAYSQRCYFLAGSVATGRESSEVKA